MLASLPYTSCVCPTSLSMNWRRSPKSLIQGSGAFVGPQTHSEHPQIGDASDPMTTGIGDRAENSQRLVGPMHRPKFRHCDGNMHGRPGAGGIYTAERVMSLESRRRRRRCTPLPCKRRTEGPE